MVIVVLVPDTVGDPYKVAVVSAPPEAACVFAVYVGLDKVVAVGNVTVALSPVIAVTVGGVTWNGA